MRRPSMASRRSRWRLGPQHAVTASQPSPARGGLISMAGRRLTATLGPSTWPSVASRITALPEPCGTLYAIRLVTCAGTVPGARARSTSTATAPDEGIAGTGAWVKRFWVAAASVSPSIRPSSVSGAIEDGHARQGHRIADHIDDEQIVFDVVLAVVAADDLRFVDRADRDRGHLRLVLSGSGDCGRGHRNGRGDDGHKCRHPRAPRDRSQGHGSLLCGGRWCAASRFEADGLS